MINLLSIKNWINCLECSYSCELQESSCFEYFFWNKYYPDTGFHGFPQLRHKNSAIIQGIRLWRQSSHRISNSSFTNDPVCRS